MHDERLIARRFHRLVEGEPHAGRTVGGDELLDVVGLREFDLAVFGLRDLDMLRRSVMGPSSSSTFQTTISCLVKEW